VVTRIQAELAVPPQGCSTNAVLTISNGVSSQSLAITGASNDSGPLSLSYAAGSSMSLRVSTAAHNCRGTVPAEANVVVQYRAN
jgi:hypothetical protein